MQSEVLKFVDATDLPGSFSAPLRLFSGFILLSKISGCFAAARPAGVFWIQTLAEIFDSVETARTARGATMLLRAPAVITEA